MQTTRLHIPYKITSRDDSRAYSNSPVAIKSEFTLGHRRRLQRTANQKIGTRTDYVIKSLVKRKIFKTVVKQLVNRLSKISGRFTHYSIIFWIRFGFGWDSVRRPDRNNGISCWDGECEIFCTTLLQYF